MYAAAKKHFRKVDPVLHRAALEHAVPDAKPSSDLFRDIVWTIIGQQLSARAADTIFARFKKLFGRGKITPQKILALREGQIRASGLSGAKARAIRNVADAVQRKELDLRAFSSLHDDAIREQMTRVKGVGPWTAEMVLMFSLGRPDVFSKGDLGLRKGVMQLYGLNTFPDEKKLLKIVGAWSPYRSYAARILWRLADKKTARIGRKRPSDE